ncbi:malonyl CoA-acyl carrier protein transacylase [Bradyrhizobium sp. F1.2.2]
MLTRFISPCMHNPAFNAARVHRNSQPAFVTTYDRPSCGLGWATHTTFPNFGKAEYFCWRGLTCVCGCFARPPETTDATTMQWTAKLLRRLLAPIVIQEVRWGATVDKVPKGFV